MGGALAGAAAALFVGSHGRLLTYATGFEPGARWAVGLLAFASATALPTLWPRLGRRLRWLGQLTLLGQLAVLGALVVARLPGAEATLVLFGKASDATGFAFGLIQALATLFPMAVAGLVVGMALARRPDRAASLAGATTLGLALGHYSVDRLVWSVGTPTAVAATALFFAATGTALGARGARARYAVLSAAVGFSVIGVSALLDFAPAASGSLARTLAAPDARVLYTRWTPGGRVDAVRFDPPRRQGAYRHLGLGDGFQSRAPRYVGIAVDGRLTTPVYDWSAPGRTETLLRHHLLSVPYLFVSKPSVLTFSRGGGTEARQALGEGARDVTDLQPNSALAHVSWHLLPDFRRRGEAGDVKRRWVDPRSELWSSERAYDLIHLNTVQPLAHEGDPRSGRTHRASAHRGDTAQPAWLERQLTVEAITAYFDRLTPTGLLAVVLEDPMAEAEGTPVRATRLSATVRESLRRMGIGRPSAHVAVVAAPALRALSVTLVKKWPFLPGEVARLRAFAAEEGFAVWHARQGEPVHATAIVLQQPALRVLDYLQRHGAQLGAVTDDRPFALSLESPQGNLRNLGNLGNLWQWALGWRSGAPAWSALLRLMLLLTLAVGFVARRRAQQPLSRPSLSWWAAYGLGGGGALGGLFACLSGRLCGLLALPPTGHRVMALSMLVAAGAGALFCQRRAPDRGEPGGVVSGALPRGLVVLLLVAGLYLLALPELAEYATGRPATDRLALAALASAIPAGLAGHLCGTALTLGGATALIPWRVALHLAGLSVGILAGPPLAETFGYLQGGMLSLSLFSLLTLLHAGTWWAPPSAVRQPAARSLETAPPVSTSSP